MTSEMKCFDEDWLHKFSVNMYFSLSTRVKEELTESSSKVERQI